MSDIQTPDEAFFERMRDRLAQDFDWYGMYEDNTVECLMAAFESAKTPPKPDEPMGLGAVVEDARGIKWSRAGSSSVDGNWLRVGSNAYVHYREIDVAHVLSDGVGA